MTKILVIEDEADLLEEIVTTLQFEDYDVVSASNGKDGVRVAYDEQPDLIISDIMMPEMDGYAVLDALRQNAETAAIPVIFLTAKAGQDFVRQGMQLGADDYLTKPFTNEHLLAAISTRLKRHATIRQTNQAELEALKKQFATMISHELRTPLNGITLAQDMIDKQGEFLSPDDMRDLIATMSRGNSRLSQVVEQMTYYTNIELGLLTPEYVTTHGQVTSVWTLLVGAIEQARGFVYGGSRRQVEMNDIDYETRILADTPSLKHAFAEIISNALKFSDAQHRIIVSQWTEGNRVFIEVADNGFGIPTDQLDAIFKPFEQIDRSTHEQQGTGLGLWLADNIVGAHGGALEVYSTEGESTQVVISLPLANA